MYQQLETHCVSSPCCWHPAAATVAVDAVDAAVAAMVVVVVVVIEVIVAKTKNKQKKK